MDRGDQQPVDAEGLLGDRVDRVEALHPALGDVGARWACRARDRDGPRPARVADDRADAFVRACMPLAADAGRLFAGRRRPSRSGAATRWSDASRLARSGRACGVSGRRAIAGRRCRRGRERAPPMIATQARARAGDAEEQRAAGPRATHAASFETRGAGTLPSSSAATTPQASASEPSFAAEAVEQLRGRRLRTSPRPRAPSVSVTSS